MAGEACSLAALRASITFTVCQRLVMVAVVVAALRPPAPRNPKKKRKNKPDPCAI